MFSCCSTHSKKSGSRIAHRKGGEKSFITRRSQVAYCCTHLLRHGQLVTLLSKRYRGKGMRQDPVQVKEGQMA